MGTMYSGETNRAYWSAKRLTEALADGTLSSRDLLETYVARIEALNPALNAVVAMNLEDARRRADEADQAVRRGESLGALHGLPLTIKDTYEVPGMACAAGCPKHRAHMPTKAAYAVQRLTDQGAIVFGKTNVPLMASDIQSYNAVYGTTRNPWNPALTPGGSSGGAAAALAAGFTPLEVGSDIGGSIRIPAHFCGVYGHKPTHGIISLRGHIPGPIGSLAEPELGVAGPMARSAEDLRLMLDILADVPPAMQPGWRLELPDAGQSRLSDFRVLMWIDDPQGRIDPQMSEVYRELYATLKSAGAQVEIEAPRGWELDRIYPLYAARLSAKMMAGEPRWQRRMMGLAAPWARLLSHFMKLPKRADRFLAGGDFRYADEQAAAEASAQLREQFLGVFDQYDVILTPPTLTTALPHDHGRFLGARKVRIDGQRRPYMDLFMWIAPATLMGLPATSAPVGLTAEGLPVNVQIMGAPYRDKTTIRFAELLAPVMGGFRKAPSMS